MDQNYVYFSCHAFRQFRGMKISRTQLCYKYDNAYYQYMLETSILYIVVGSELTDLQEM